MFIRDRDWETTFNASYEDIKYKFSANVNTSYAGPNGVLGDEGYQDVLRIL